MPWSVSANVREGMRDGILITAPLAANTSVKKGDLVWLDANGRVKGALATVGDIFVGVAADSATCGTTAGASSIRIYQKGAFSFASHSGIFNQASLGASVGLDTGANGTPQKVVLATTFVVGRVIGTVSATEAYVAIDNHVNRAFATS